MTDTAARPTRRDLLRTGTLGAAAAAFLAACTAKIDNPGQSGADPTTTLVTPTVPLEEPSDAEKQADLTVLMTMTSVELLAADLYGQYGPVLTDAEWATEAARYATDHGVAAEAHAAATPADIARLEAKADEELHANQTVVEPDSDTIASTEVEAELKAEAALGEGAVEEAKAVEVELEEKDDKNLEHGNG